MTGPGRTPHTDDPAEGPDDADERKPASAREHPEDPAEGAEGTDADAAED